MATDRRVRHVEGPKGTLPLEIAADELTGHDLQTMWPLSFDPTPLEPMSDGDEAAWAANEGRWQKDQEHPELARFTRALADLRGPLHRLAFVGRHRHPATTALLALRRTAVASLGAQRLRSIIAYALTTEAPPSTCYHGVDIEMTRIEPCDVWPRAEQLIEAHSHSTYDQGARLSPFFDRNASLTRPNPTHGLTPEQILEQYERDAARLPGAVCGSYAVDRSHFGEDIMYRGIWAVHPGEEGSAVPRPTMVFIGTGDQSETYLSPEDSTLPPTVGAVLLEQFVSQHPLKPRGWRPKPHPPDAESW